MLWIDLAWFEGKHVFSNCVCTLECSMTASELQGGGSRRHTSSLCRFSG
jgi:hypothetical protein